MTFDVVATCLYYVINQKTSQDILEWWRENRTALTLLAALARAVLAVPVSASKSERTFSKGGLFVTLKSQRLAADLIECIIIISQNSCLLGFDDC